MSNKYEAIIYRLATDILGDYDLDNLNQRIQLQKVFYLFQRRFFNLNLRFNWYIYGPYAPKLAKTLFSIEEDKERIKTKARSLKPSQNVQAAVQQIKSLIENKPGSADQTHWLEALGSIEFLMNQQGQKFDDIRAQLAREKPKLTDTLLEESRKFLTSLPSL